jgi:uncharacterized protein YqhQ
VPLIAGIAYEFIKWAGARYQTHGWIRALMAPGLAVQALTTREPDLDQIEVAIKALEPVLAAEEPHTVAEAIAEEKKPEPAIAS